MKMYLQLLPWFCFLISIPAIIRHVARATRGNIERLAAVLQTSSVQLSDSTFLSTQQLELLSKQYYRSPHSIPAALTEISSTILLLCPIFLIPDQMPGAMKIAIFCGALVIGISVDVLAGRLESNAMVRFVSSRVSSSSPL